MLQELIHILPVPLCLASVDDRIVTWNAALTQLFREPASSTINAADDRRNMTGSVFTFAEAESSVKRVSIPPNSTRQQDSIRTLHWEPVRILLPDNSTEQPAESCESALPGLAALNRAVQWIGQQSGRIRADNGHALNCVVNVFCIRPDTDSSGGTDVPSFLWLVSAVSEFRSAPGVDASPRDASRDVVVSVPFQTVPTKASTEMELWASEMDFARVALGSVQCGLWERDLKSDRLWWSSSQERQMGLLPGEFAGTVDAFMEMVHPACRAKVLVARDEALTNGGRYEAELQFIHKDGSLRWGQVRGTVIRDAAGQPDRIVGIQIDVTEKKLAEQAARQAADWMKALSSTVPATFYSFVLNPDNTFQMPFCSDSSLSILGLPAETISRDPRRLLGLLDPADLNGCRHSIRQSAVLMQEWRQQFRIRHPHKGLRWIEGRSQPQRTADGRTLWSGVLTDITENKRLQQDVERHRRRLQTILDSVPAPIFVKDQHQRYLQVNREMCLTVGLSAESMMGRTDSELGLSGPYVSQSDDMLVISTGQSLRAALEPVHTPTGIRWLQTDRIPYSEEPRGILEGLIGVAVDVTDRVNAEIAMRDSESRLLEAQIIGRIGSFYWDAAADHMDWSRNLYRLFGIDPGDFHNSLEDFLNLISASERDVIRSQLQRALVKDGDFSHEFRIQRPDGEIRWLQACGRILRNERKVVHGIAGTCQDITEQKEAEDQLRASEELHRNLLNAIPYAVLIHVNEMIQFSNSAAAALVGFQNAEQLLGMSVHDILVGVPTGRDVHVARDRSRWLLPENDIPEKLEYTLHRCDGTSISVESIATPVVFGGTPSVLVALHDLTRRRMMEADLRQAQKMEAVGRLAGGIAHDFNNLLTVILGYSELLLSSASLSDPATPLIAEINKAGNRAAGLTRQLLTFSRRQNVVPILADLNWLVLNSLQMLQRIVGENVTISIDLFPDPVPIVIDPLQLEQVLMNLVANSRDAMPQGGRIVVHTTRVLNEDELPQSVLSLSDSGTGIPPGIVDRVFDPFFTTKEPGQGVGLGLAVVHGIVEEAGGRVEVRSDPGQFTSLSIYFPHTGESLPEIPDVTPRYFSQVKGGSETVLIVEDEDAVRDITAMALRSCGYDVHVAMNGTVALQVMNAPSIHIELIASDVFLPDMSARVLADAVQSNHRTTKLLFMSGYTEDAVARHGIDSTEFAFIQKPFTPEVFCNMVRAVLDSHDDQLLPDP